MSKAVLPVLDASNVVTDVVSMYGGTDYGWVCDPVAKLVCSLIQLPGEYQPDYSSFQYMERIGLSYSPAMEKADLLSGEYSRAHGEGRMKSVGIAGVWATFRRVDELEICFLLHDKISGVGFSPRDFERPVTVGPPRTYEGDPGYEFWPAGLPERNQAVMEYLLKAVPLLLVQTNGRRARLAGPPAEKLAVAIDSEVAELVGQENLHVVREMEDCLIVFEGDLLDV